MGITVKNLVILIVIIGAGVWAYSVYGPKIEVDKLKPDAFQQADLYFTGGAFDKAIPAYRAAIAEKPDDARAGHATFFIAKAIDQDKRTDNTGQMAEAAAAYKKYLKEFPQGENKEEAKKRIDQLDALGVK